MANTKTTRKNTSISSGPNIGRGGIKQPKKVRKVKVAVKRPARKCYSTETGKFSETTRKARCPRGTRSRKLGGKSGIERLWVQKNRYCKDKKNNLIDAIGPAKRCPSGSRSVSKKKYDAQYTR